MWDRNSKKNRGILGENEQKLANFHGIWKEMFVVFMARSPSMWFAGVAMFAEKRMVDVWSVLSPHQPLQQYAVPG